MLAPHVLEESLNCLDADERGPHSRCPHRNASQPSHNGNLPLRSMNVPMLWNASMPLRKESFGNDN